MLGQVIEFSTGGYVDAGLAENFLKHGRRYFKFLGLLQVLRLSQGIRHGMALLSPADGDGRMDDQIVNGHVSQVQLIRIADANEDIEELRDIDIGKEALKIGHLSGVAGLEEVILR